MRRIVALTGAGISRPSGIPTYEERPQLRELFTLEYLWDDPVKFWDGYRGLYAQLKQAQANPAHWSLARTEIPVVTQNIDRLHHAAGTDAIELHGRYDRFICQECGAESFSPDRRCSACGEDSMRPDIVLFGEVPKQWEQAVDLVYEAQVLLVIGTSLTVYPAAELVPLAQRNGAEIITINSGADTRVPELLSILSGTGSH